MVARFRDLFGNIKEERIDTAEQIIYVLQNPECTEVCDEHYSLRKNGSLYELESNILPDNRNTLVKTFNSLVPKVYIEDIQFYLIGINEVNRSLFTNFKDFIQGVKMCIGDAGAYINAGDKVVIYYNRGRKDRTIVTNVNTKLINELVKEIES